MNLEQIVSVFEKAERAESPYPSWEIIDEAFASITRDESLFQQIQNHLTLSNWSESDVLTIFSGGRGFAKTVDAAKAILPLLSCKLKYDSPGDGATKAPLQR